MKQTCTLPLYISLILTAASETISCIDINQILSAPSIDIKINRLKNSQQSLQPDQFVSLIEQVIDQTRTGEDKEAILTETGLLLDPESCSRLTSSYFQIKDSLTSSCNSLATAHLVAQLWNNLTEKTQNCLLPILFKKGDLPNFVLGKVWEFLSEDQQLFYLKKSWDLCDVYSRAKLAENFVSLLPVNVAKEFIQHVFAGKTNLYIALPWAANKLSEEEIAHYLKEAWSTYSKKDNNYWLPQLIPLFDQINPSYYYRILKLVLSSAAPLKIKVSALTHVWENLEEKQDILNTLPSVINLAPFKDRIKSLLHLRKKLPAKTWSSILFQRLTAGTFGEKLELLKGCRKQSSPDFFKRAFELTFKNGSSSDKCSLYDYFFEELSSDQKILFKTLITKECDDKDKQPILSLL
ncbi:TPA: hypothetical protein DDZ86_01925 [Candidatus Dependentiae bacterium]|nr:MAG: hypothetical protein UW09_C0001G0251 [candidate division TM6 bacterium GW2011_GWF2_43_87]HBL98383.1 hypothetical protein [Candidatus Dependentiae bacterium]